MMLFELLPFLNFILCNFANVISRKVLWVEARNFYQLVEYGTMRRFSNENLKKNHMIFFLNKCCLNIVLFSLIFCNCYIIVFSLVDF